MFRWCALILVILLNLNGPVDARVRTTADAIIVEVGLNDERGARSTKTPSGTYLLAEENRCWTSDGHQGVCDTLRSCYPGYQLPEMKNFESLNELSIRGTCQYNKVDGSQAYGVCCSRQGTYSSPSFFGNIFEGGKPQFGDGSFSWLQPAGFPWWGARGAGAGFPKYPSFHSIPALFPSLAPVGMGSPAIESPESWTTEPISTETGTPSTSTPSTPTQPSLEQWTLTTKKPSTTTTAQQLVITNPPDHGSEGVSKEVPCGMGPYKTLSWDEQDRILIGYTAVKNSWPFMVSMQSNQRHFCGASLINENYVLTAAHCIASFTSADVKKLEVVLAMHKTKGDTSGIRKRVSRLVRHKGYNPRTLYNDIAIMKLDSPATFGPTISAVCLPPASSSHSERYGKDEATVIGWGSTRIQRPLPEALQRVTVKVQTNEKCKNNYASGDIPDSMICASFSSQDSCLSIEGDSGGPMLMHPGPGSPWTQVGVVSWGNDCSSKSRLSGVYTSVAHFIGWINENAT